MQELRSCHVVVAWVWTWYRDNEYNMHRFGIPLHSCWKLGNSESVHIEYNSHGYIVASCDLRKNIRPPLCHGREEPGREISSRIDGITRVESKGGSNNQEKQTNSQRLQSNSITIGVLWISDGKDAKQEEECTNHLYWKIKLIYSIIIISMTASGVARM